MSKTEWNVLPHGPLQRLAENLWTVDGTLPGMSLGRVMTVARRADGRLVIHSAIALDAGAMGQLESLGEMSFLIVPNRFHCLDAPAYKQRYPNMTVLTPVGSRAKASEKVQIDGGYDAFPADSAVRLEMLAGVKGIEGAMIVRSEDGETIVLTDVVFNLPKKPADALGWFFTTVMSSAPGPRTSRLFKLMVVDDKRALREDLLRLAAMPKLVRLVVAHGAISRGEDAANTLRAATTCL